MSLYTLYNQTKYERCGEFELTEQWFKGSLASQTLWALLYGDWRGDEVAVVNKNAFKKKLVKKDPWKAKIKYYESDFYPIRNIAECNGEKVDFEEGAIIKAKETRLGLQTTRIDSLMLLLTVGNDCYNPDQYSTQLVGTWAFKPIELKKESDAFDISAAFDPDGWYCSMTDEDIEKALLKCGEIIPEEGIDGMDLFNMLGVLEGD